MLVSMRSLWVHVTLSWLSCAVARRRPLEHLPLHWFHFLCPSSFPSQRYRDALAPYWWVGHALVAWSLLRRHERVAELWPKSGQSAAAALLFLRPLAAPARAALLLLSLRATAATVGELACWRAEGDDVIGPRGYWLLLFVFLELCAYSGGPAAHEEGREAGRAASLLFLWHAHLWNMRAAHVCTATGWALVCVELLPLPCAAATLRLLYALRLACIWGAAAPQVAYCSRGWSCELLTHPEALAITLILALPWQDRGVPPLSSSQSGQSRGAHH